MPNEDFEQEDTEIFEKVDSLTVNNSNVIGTVFLIPLDAPVPLELSDIEMPTGPLLIRLQPLANEKPEGDIALLPISGPELLALSRAWTLLRVAKKIAVLTDLPGAREDIIFAQARRQIGLKTVEWPTLTESFAKRKIERQRTGDKQPWLTKDEPDTSDKPALREARGSNLKSAVNGLPTPGESDEDSADL
jgi:hypothetical protein